MGWCLPGKERGCGGIQQGQSSSETDSDSEPVMGAGSSSGKPLHLKNKEHHPGWGLTWQPYSNRPSPPPPPRWFWCRKNEPCVKMIAVWWPRKAPSSGRLHQPQTLSFPRIKPKRFLNHRLPHTRGEGSSLSPLLSQPCVWVSRLLPHPRCDAHHRADGKAGTSRLRS